MKTLLLLALALPCALVSVIGQVAAPRPPRTVSPELAADRHVTFRLLAASAHEVVVSGQWDRSGRTALARGDDGVWSATVGPIEPGIYEYSFSVDGLSIVDPGNPAIKPQRGVRASILQVPGDPPLVWDWQDVPHGTLHAQTYFAKTLQRRREVVVYTPPGYEGSAPAEYPVLVLIHGFGDNQEGWSRHGKAHWMLDNLIAQKKAQPMIVVMPDGHPIPPDGPPREEYGLANSAAFEHELLEDILPLVEATYRVRKGAGERAIAGLSMGGAHALNCGLGHTDRFGWIGSFSGGLAMDRLAAALQNPEEINAHVKLLWIAIGKDDRGRPRNEQLVEELKTKGVRYTWRLSEGDHSWPVWRGYFAEFAPLLFQPSPAPERGQ